LRLRLRPQDFEQCSWKRKDKKLSGGECWRSKSGYVERLRRLGSGPRRPGCKLSHGKESRVP